MKPARLLLAASLLVLSGTASAQVSGPAKPVANQPAGLVDPERARAGIPADPVRQLSTFVNVGFDSGTVGQYLDVIRAAAQPSPVNVVISEEAQRVTLAPIRLEHVTLDTALAAISPAAGANGQWEVKRLGDSEGGASPAWAIRYYEPPRMIRTPTGMFQTGNMPSQLEVMSIQDLITPDAAVPGDQPYKPETVLSAVDSALHTIADSDSGSPAVVKFHAESGVLFVYGSEMQTKAVKDVLGRLMENRERIRRMHREVSNREQGARAEMQMRMMSLQQQADNAKREAMARQREVDTIMKLREQGGASEQQLNTARDALMEAENQVKLAEVQARGMEAGLRGAGGGPGSISVKVGGDAGQQSRKLIEALRDAVNDPNRLSIAPANNDQYLIVSGDAGVLQLIMGVLPPDSAQPVESSQPPPPARRPARGGGGEAK